MKELKYAKVIRETEKAALVEVRLGDEYKREVWFPKSQIEINEGKVFASDWILDKKDEEIAAASYNRMPAIWTVWNEELAVA